MYIFKCGRLSPLLLSLLLCACQFNAVGDGTMFGVWSVDAEKTTEYAKKLNISPGAIALLECSVIKTKLTIGRETIRYDVPDYACSYAGKNAVIKGWSNVYQYKIKHEKDAVTILEVWQKNDEVYAKKNNVKLNWVNDDLLWIDEKYDSLNNIRYFYRRDK